MIRRVRRLGVCVLALWVMVELGGVARAQVASCPLPGPIRSLDDLARLDICQMQTLYRMSPPAGVPASGKVKGRPLVMPGSPLAVPASRAGRVAWQGKVFCPEDSTAVNRFFGARIIRGRLSTGASWLDGGPSLILDYSETSQLYRDYRDEIREVSPGLMLGLMYDRRDPQAGPVMYFALDTRK